MKRILTPVTFFLVTAAASAQCTPDPLYTDSVFGVWPDTLENFADGVVGVFYSDTMNILIPENATDIDPGYPNVVIDSIQLTNVAGLPPGLNVLCNSQTGGACTYLPTVLGCGLIEGTPTTVGSYPIQLDVTAFFTLFGSAVPFPTSFTGYEITIAPSTGVADFGAPRLSGARNTPNPFSGRTNIEFDLSAAAPVTISVFNLVGEEMQRIAHTGTPGTNKVVFDGSELGEGVYIYKVEAGAASFTGRMVLNR